MHDSPVHRPVCQENTACEEKKDGFRASPFNGEDRPYFRGERRGFRMEGEPGKRTVLVCCFPYRPPERVEEAMVGVERGTSVASVRTASKGFV